MPDYSANARGRQSKAGLSRPILQCGMGWGMLPPLSPGDLMRHQMAFWVVGGEYTGTQIAKKVGYCIGISTILDLIIIHSRQPERRKDIA